ncbi:hypothetical protein DUNSADRAFT_5696 [Dunaliella salina]|uniref:Encoded protein n=1 Tax=Dunaliella salina TaxID=3046 RepID=A0ABQ7FU44_DUNSA|nr:hypothetical protein DUNSADRAFT_5696 [Dunaliella salina]|eukprot:KAF5825950.1 hypothetical protein DUNSADRAFT_5696 [Dunaliella salina]
MAVFVARSVFAKHRESEQLPVERALDACLAHYHYPFIHTVTPPPKAEASRQGSEVLKLQDDSLALVSSPSVVHPFCDLEALQQELLCTAAQEACVLLARASATSPVSGPKRAYHGPARRLARTLESQDSDEDEARPRVESTPPPAPVPAPTPAPAPTPKVTEAKPEAPAPPAGLCQFQYAAQKED